MNIRIKKAIRRTITFGLIITTFSSSVLPTFAVGKLPDVYEGINDFNEEDKDTLSSFDMEKLLEGLSKEYEVEAPKEVESEPTEEYREECEKIVDVSFSDELFNDVSFNLPLEEVIIGESELAESESVSMILEDIALSESVSENQVYIEENLISSDVSGDDFGPVNMASFTPIEESEGLTIELLPNVNASLNNYVFKGLNIEGTIAETENLTKVVLSVPGEEVSQEIDISEIISSKRWSIESPIESFSVEKPYVFLIEAFYEKEVEEVSSSAGTVSENEGQTFFHKETTIKRAYSPVFMLHEVRRGEKVKSISKNTGASVKNIKADNKIGIFNPKAGSLLFLRDVLSVVEEAFEWTEEAIGTIQNLGSIKGCEYAYGIVNLSTLDLLYDEEDLSITERESFSLIRHYRSKLCEVKGFFGRGISSLFDESVIDISDDEKLVIEEDYKGILLKRSGNAFVSDNGIYTLIESENGYELTDNALNYRKFNKEGLIEERGSKKGIIYQISYDENDNPKALRTVGGKTFSIECNRAGLIERIEKPDSTFKKYTYNEDKLLCKVTNERGYDSIYEYDSGRRLLSATDQMGKKNLVVSYDNADRVISYTDGQGNTSSFSMEGNNVTFRDPKGVITVYSRNLRNQTEKIAYSDGKQELKTVDEKGNLLSFTDKAGNKTTYVYDVSSNLLSQTDAAGISVSYSYDAKSNLISQTDANGNKTDYVYDSAGNMTQIINPDKTQTVMTFDSLGRMTSLKGPDGNVTSYEYEGSTYNVSKVTDPKGNETINTYDVMGRVLSTTSNGKSTTYTYNETGKTLSVTDPNGKTEKYEYDACDNSIGVTDPLGNKVSMRYDAFGRIIQVINADNTHTDFTYDSNGNLVKEVSSTGVEKTYTYNENDELIGEKASNGEEIKYERDSLGRVIKETYEDGATVTYEYHKTLNLVTKKKDELDRTITYDYDNMGNLLKESYSNGLFITYTYDSNNRETSVTDAKGIKTEYVYDAGGRIIKETESKDGKRREKTYEYDSNGNLTKQTDFEGASLSYAYDSENRMVKVTDSLGYSTEYTYGATGERLSEKDRNGNVRRFEYDSNGNLTKEIDPEGNVYTYKYDSEGRLSMNTLPDGSTQGVVYNAEGYPVKKVDAYGYIEELSYDDNGNITSIKKADGSKSTFSYDSKNRKIKEVDANGLTTQYKYNKLGWLLKVIYDNGTSAVYTYDYNGKAIAIEYSSGVKEIFDYSNYGDLLGHTDKDGGKASYTYDTFGNIVSVFDSTTGIKEDYTLNKNGKMLRKEDNKGNYTEYVYDKRGALIKTIDDEGKCVEFEYDGCENVIGVKEYYRLKKDVSDNSVSSNNPVDAIVSANDVSFNETDIRVTRMEYDSNGNITKIILPDGSTSSSIYDFNGNVLKSTDGNGNTTTYTYEANGKVKTKTTPEGNIYTYGYDCMGNLEYEKDPLGNIESYTYNSAGKMTSITKRNGAKNTFEYSKEGLLTKEIDSLGNTKAYEYDLYGNEIKVTYPNGIFESKEYDALGRVTVEKDIYGLKTFYSYDNRGNVSVIEKEAPEMKLSSKEEIDVSLNDVSLNEAKDASSNESVSFGEKLFESGLYVTKKTKLTKVKTTYTYDSYNRLIREETEGLVPTEYIYDKKDRVVKKIFGDSFIETQYDKWGNVEKEADSTGLTAEFTYNLAGKLLKQESPDVTVTFTYDKCANKISETSPTGEISYFSYDKDYNIISTTDGNGNKTSYSYDKVGNVISIKDALGGEILYDYDANGNVIKETSTDGAETLYGYDKLDRIVKVTDPDLTSIYYEYDSIGNVIKETICDENDKYSFVTGEPSRKECFFRYADTGDLLSYGSFGETEEEYKYYAGGIVSSVKYPSGKEISYEYDRFGNSTAVYHNGLLNVKREYNNKNELIKQTDSLGTTEYAYDETGKLVSAKSKAGEVKYTYDLYGNTTSITYPNKGMVQYEYDASNRLTKAVGLDKIETVFEYDSCGNEVSKTSSNGIKTRTTFDALNRKTKVINENDAGLLNEFTYTYDKGGRVFTETEKDQSKTLYKAFGYDKAGKLVKALETENVDYNNDEFLKAFVSSSLFAVQPKDVSGNVSENDISANDVSFNEENVKAYTDLKLVSYEYDTFGNKTKEISYENRKKTVTEFNHNKLGQLEKKLVNGKLSESYKYDKDGNLTEKKAGGKVTTYVYTVDNYLKATAINGKIVESVNYDGNGLKTFSLLRKEYSDTIESNVKERITGNNEATYKWERFFNEESTTDTNDFFVQGSDDYTFSKITGTKVNEAMMNVAFIVGSFMPLMFDEWLEFAKAFSEDIKDFFVEKGTDESYYAESKDGDEESSTGKLISKILSPKETETEKKSYHDEVVEYYESSYFIYDLTKENPVLLCEESTPGAVNKAYTYANDERLSSSGGDSYIYDARGSVKKVVNNKKVTASYEYDPYGNIQKGAPLQDRFFGYNAEEYTPQTGLIYLRARNYDPSLGCFTSKDTYLGNRTNPITKNRYTFANDNPVMNMDPSGHASLGSKIVGAVKNLATKAQKTVQKAVNTVKTFVAQVKQVVSQAVSKAVTSTAAKQGANVAKQTSSVAKPKTTSTSNRLLTAAKNGVEAAVHTFTNRVLGTKGNNVQQNGVLYEAIVGQSNLSAAIIEGEDVFLTESLGISRSSVKNYIYSSLGDIYTDSVVRWAEGNNVKDNDITHKIFGKLIAKEQRRSAIWCSSFADNMYQRVTSFARNNYDYNVGLIETAYAAVEAAVSATEELVKYDLSEEFKPILSLPGVSDVVEYMERHPVAKAVFDVTMTAVILYFTHTSSSSGTMKYAYAAGSSSGEASIVVSGFNVLAKGEVVAVGGAVVSGELVAEASMPNGNFNARARELEWQKEQALKITNGKSTVIKKSDHAKIRSSQGRNVNTAINDINKSTPSKVYLQDDGRIVIRGEGGRVHILEPNGEIVTTMNKVPNFDSRVLSGRYRAMTVAEQTEFASKFGDYLGKAWDVYRTMH